MRTPVRSGHLCQTGWSLRSYSSYPYVVNPIEETPVEYYEGVRMVRSCVHGPVRGEF